MINHDVNGHGKNTLVRLHKLLAYHEHTAAALRTTLGLLEGQAAVTAKAAAPDVLAAALSLDAERREKRRDRSGTTKASRTAVRVKSARLLATFDRTTPRPAKGKRIGVYLTRGYLRKKGDGYVRTAKPFVANVEGP